MIIMTTIISLYRFCNFPIFHINMLHNTQRMVYIHRLTPDLEAMQIAVPCQSKFWHAILI